MEKLRQYLYCEQGITDEKRLNYIIEKLEGYMKEILEWNLKVNLTAIKNEEDFIEKHFIDSFLPVKEPELKKAARVIDVGTGGGFPGVPLAAVFPEKQFVLVDSLEKRINIIDRTCRKLGIENVKAVHGRAEDLAKTGSGYRESFDVCVSRAVANLSTLSEYCLPFVRKGGSFIAYKTYDEDELRRAENAIRQTGGETDRLIEGAHLKEAENHCLVVINKVRQTPDIYPRRAGIPARKPL